MKFAPLAAALFAVSFFQMSWGAESISERALKLVAGYEDFLVAHHTGYVVSTTEWSIDTKQKTKSARGAMARADGVLLYRFLFLDGKTGTTQSGLIQTTAGRANFFNSSHAIIERTISSSSTAPAPQALSPEKVQTRDEIISSTGFHHNYYGSFDTTGKIEILEKNDGALGDIVEVRNFISPVVRAQLQTQIDAEIERTYLPSMAAIIGPKPKVEAPSVAVYDFAKKSGVLMQMSYLTGDGSLIYKSTIDSLIVAPEIKESDVTGYPADTNDWTIVQASETENDIDILKTIPALKEK